MNNQTLSKTGNRRGLLILILFLSSATIYPTLGDELHYNNIIVGNRAAGMGGAYTAISDDATGLYYNPAGIVYAGGSNVSASTNAYNITNTEYKNALGDALTWTRKSSVLFPNFFGMFQPLGKGKIGFLYAVPDSILEDQDQTFYNIPNTNPAVSRFTINFNNKDTTYNFGPSYALSVNDTFSLGLTLNIYIRNQKRISNQLTYLSNGTDSEWLNSYYTANESGVRPVLGAMWTISKKLSFGLAISKILITDSNTKLQLTCKGATNLTYDPNGLCQNNQLNDSVIETSEKRDLPLSIATGVAYFPNRSLVLDFDLTYFSSTDDSFVSGRDSVINFALGGEYYVNPTWALRSGFYSNYANTPDLTNHPGSGNIQPEHVDMYGLSFSISHFARKSVLTGGVDYKWGAGKAQLFNTDSNGKTQLQDLNQNSLTLFLSASYSY